MKKNYKRNRQDAWRRKNYMEDKNINGQAAQEAEELQTEAIQEEATEPTEVEESQEENKASELEELRAEVEKQKKEYLFLMAEFDNFRKRTLKEKSELIKNAGEGVLKGLLPIVDDFERGIKAEEASGKETVDEGMQLIYNKLIKYLGQNGVKAIDPEDRDFDTERHEAISVVPVADESQKGKILDTVEKGYTINDKVLRHAKVVVGQ